MSYGSSLSASFLPLSTDALNSVTAILQKAEQAPNSASFLEARLAEDMLPLTFQVYIVADVAQKGVARASGTEPLTLPKHDTLKSYADLYKLLDQAKEVVAKADAKLIDSRANAIVTAQMGGKGVDFEAQAYIKSYTLSNLFFHVITTYNILRNQGVPLGKNDYLNPFLGPQ